MNVQISERMFGGHMCYLSILITLIVFCEVVLVAVNGARFEQKSHGLRTELAAHSVGNPFTVDSRTMCASACSKQTCDLIYYSAATNSCTIYNTYMSDDQPPLEGLYGKTGAIDKKPCQMILDPPSHGSVSYSGTSYGDTASYICDLGYKIGTGPSTRTCSANGIWPGDTPSCVSSWEMTKKIVVTNGGPHGTWGPIEYCQSGSYAYSYELKIEADQGQNFDDSALNGVKLHCKTLDGQHTGFITSTQEQFGTWKGPKACGQMEFLTGFKLQVQSNQGPEQDDTSVNFVKVTCRKFTVNPGHRLSYISPGEGPHGSYGSWSGFCGLKRAVCGIRTKVHAYLGPGDDTALNDVMLYCCS